MSDLLPDLSRYDLVAVDTETTGVRVQDRPVGLSWFTPDGRGAYARWGHPEGNNCSLAQVRRWVKRELDRPGLDVAMHEANFDLRMLARSNAPVDRATVHDTQFIYALLNELEPSLALDDLGEKKVGIPKIDDELNQYCADNFGGRPTRRAQAKNYHRCPGEVVEAYAIQDARATCRLFQCGYPLLPGEDLDEVYELERSLIPLLLKMHLHGVRVDVDRARRVQGEIRPRLERENERWREIAGDDVNLGSTQQLARVLRRLGIRVPTTAKGNPSVTKEYLNSLDHPIGALIRTIRELTYYHNVALESYVIGNAIDGLVHGSFHPLRTADFGTVSGRFSSSDPNLQNLPARDEEWAPVIRGCFIPYTDAHDWLKIDYSQIEFRYLAHYAGGALAHAYNQDPDVDFHSMVAELTGIPRKPAKNINFAMVYGAGVMKLAEQLGVSPTRAQEILNEYHSRLPDVRRLYEKADRRAARKGFIRTWGGRKRRFRKSPDGRYHEKTYRSLNALLQGSAADLIKKAMLSVAEVVDWKNTFLHLTVHDELGFSIPRGEAGVRFAREVKERMEAFELKVPVKADAGVGADWGNTKTLSLNTPSDYDELHGADRHRTPSHTR